LSDQKVENKKKVHIISLGCPKNLVDSEIMYGTLKNKGYDLVKDQEQADTIIVNTCGFIEDAKEESINTVLGAANLKKSGSLKKLVVAGCLTQRYKDDLVEGLPEADLFVGSGQFQNIDDILEKAYEGDKKKTYFNLPTYLQEENTPRLNSQFSHRAYLKISEGCKKRCAFCAIPLIRGNLQSRKIENIVSEAKLLVASGVRELIVISHDFTDFGWDLKKKDPSRTDSPYNLLKELSEKSGADWIRVLYLYPDGIDEKMIKLIKNSDNLVKYFDMPLQHINNDMLKSMNRRVTKDQIVKCLDQIRTEIPEAVIRTQFIVGYPGETEEQFEELLAFIKEQKFERVGAFKYSIEENTKAGTLPNQVGEATKQDRYDRLMSLQKPISKEKHQVLVDKVIPVIIDGVSDETELLLQGRYTGQAPDIDGIVYINEGQAKQGEIVNVKITESHDYDLVGSII